MIIAHPNSNLFITVPQLELPSVLLSYLLCDVTLHVPKDEELTDNEEFQGFLDESQQGSDSQEVNGNSKGSDDDDDDDYVFSMSSDSD